jgi:hypothetical protein
VTAPSPTADATLLTDPQRTSPAAAAGITLPALCPEYPGTAPVRELVCAAGEPKGSRAWEPGLSQALVYR